MFSNRINASRGRKPGVPDLITLSGSVNFDTYISPGRTSPDAISYNVFSLTSNSATLASAPGAADFAEGDTVILMHLLGGPTRPNSGNYEYLTVSSVVGSTVSFLTPKTKYYGTGATSDAGLGATLGSTQIVVLRRVPQWKNVVINAGCTLSCNTWNNLKYGQIIFNCDNLTNNGNIDVSARGFSLGQGISAGYPGGNSGGGAGHAFAGLKGNYDGGFPSSAGAGGPASGVANLSKIYMGSGGGVCISSGNGGGIIMINAPVISRIGSLNSVGNQGFFSGSSAGGSILIRSTTLTCGVNSISAAGGTGGGESGDASVGRIAIFYSSISGTLSSVPAAVINPA
jgi:hypothetical protein